mgnify:CR=1 FL=1
MLLQIQTVWGQKFRHILRFNYFFFFFVMMIRNDISTKILNKSVRKKYSYLGPPRGSSSCVQIYLWKISNSSHLCIISFFASWPVAIITTSKMGNLYFGQHYHPFFQKWYSMILLVKHKLFTSLSNVSHTVVKEYFLFKW